MLLLGLPPDPQVGFLSAHPHLTHRIAAELHLSLQFLELRPLVLARILSNRRKDTADLFFVVPFLSEVEDVFDLARVVDGWSLVEEGYLVVLELYGVDEAVLLVFYVGDGVVGAYGHPWRI